MNLTTRAKIVELLTNPDYDGMPQQQIAAELGISDRTLRNYLTAEVWTEVRQARLEVLYRSMALVDRAVFYKASQGDIHAAKLIYARWDDMKQTLPAGYDLHNLAAVDDAIAGLQQRIDQLEHPVEFETATAAAVTAEARTAEPEQAAPLSSPPEAAALPPVGGQ